MRDHGNYIKVYNTFNFDSYIEITWIFAFSYNFLPYVRNKLMYLQTANTVRVANQLATTEPCQYFSDNFTASVSVLQPNTKADNTSASCLRRIWARCDTAGLSLHANGSRWTDTCHVSDLTDGLLIRTKNYGRLWLNKLWTIYDFSF